MGVYSNANKLCICGSGKKYKKCCLKNDLNISRGQEVSDFSKILSLMIEKRDNLFDMDRDELEKIVDLIECEIKKSTLSSSDKKYIYLNFYQYYVLLGEDAKALELINYIDIDNLDITIQGYILIQKAKVLLNLSHIDTAYKMAIKALDIGFKLKWKIEQESQIKSAILIEAGRIMSIIRHKYEEISGDKIDNIDIISIYDELIENYENGNYNNIDHYLGAKSNKASYLLKDDNFEIQNKGIHQMQEVISHKVKCGYWNGVANNYSMLGVYYLRVKNYKQAIAYMNRDLYLTQKYGSIRDEISTLLNLSHVYIEARQISKARLVLNKAKKLADETRNSSIVMGVMKRLNEINEISKKLKSEGLNIGPKSDCVCGSGKSFKDCCGEADFEYESIEKVLGLNRLIHYTTIVNDSRDNSIINNNENLNLILRDLDKDEVRLSWCKLIQNGAYSEVYELPDMASIYLTSARTLLKNFDTDDLMEETSIALSITMLSVSALEAFLNQLIYFLSTIDKSDLPDFMIDKIPDDIFIDHMKYQRNSRFTDKINTIANIFCNGKWNIGIGNIYKDLFKLIDIRNELVHFKSVEYIQIIPPKENSNILKNLSSEIVLRDISNSWPLKLLNKSFAMWSLKTIEETINYIKKSYMDI